VKALQLLRRAGRVGWGDWPIALSTVAIALAVEVGLRTRPLPRLARRLGVELGSPDGPVAPGPLSLPPADRRRTLVALAVMRHWPFDEKCLRRSLVIGYRLRHHRPALVVGVAIAGGDVAAHAWLVVDGVRFDPGASGASADAVFLPLGPVSR